MLLRMKINPRRSVLPAGRIQGIKVEIEDNANAIYVYIVSFDKRRGKRLQLAGSFAIEGKLNFRLCRFPVDLQHRKGEKIDRPG